MGDTKAIHPTERQGGVPTPRQPVRHLNIGSGNWRHPDWHNLDAASTHYAKSFDYGVDFPHNLLGRTPIAIADDTLKAAYSSHVIEHIDDGAAAFLFADVWRMLQPGGVFRITCPDMGLIFRRYARRDEAFFARFAFRKAWPDLSLEQAFLHCFAAVRTTHVRFEGAGTLDDGAVAALFDGALRRRRVPVFGRRALHSALDTVTRAIPAEEANRTYPQCHLNWWTHHKARTFLRRAGFSRVVAQKRRSTCYRPMGNRKHFNNTRPWMSLYIEGVK
ncbi:MAG: hypothetical protein AAF899_12130 [Pseudomonadota bacterium]